MISMFKICQTYDVQVEVQVQKSFILIVTYQEYKYSGDWNPAGLFAPIIRP